MSFVLTLVLGVALLVFVTTGARIVNAGALVPDPTIVLVVWATVSRDAVAGIWTALVLGYLAGTLTAGPRAPLLLALLVLVGTTAWMRRQFPMQSATAAASWVVFACVLVALVEAGAAVLFIEGMRIGSGLWTNVPAGALLTALVAWPLYFVLFRVEPLLRERQERTSLLG